MFGTALTSFSKGFLQGDNQAYLRQQREETLRQMKQTNDERDKKTAFQDNKRQLALQQMGATEADAKSVLKDIDDTKVKYRTIAHKELDTALLKSGQGNYEPMKRVLTDNTPNNPNRVLKQSLEKELGGVITDVRHPDPNNHLKEGQKAEDEISNDMFEVEVLTPTGEKRTELVSGLQLGALVGTPTRVGTEAFHKDMTTVPEEAQEANKTHLQIAKLMSVNYDGTIANYKSNLAVAASLGSDDAQAMLRDMAILGAKDDKSLSFALGTAIAEGDDDPKKKAQLTSLMTRLRQQSMSKEKPLDKARRLYMDAVSKGDLSALRKWKGVLDSFKQPLPTAGSENDAMNKASQGNASLTNARNTQADIKRNRDMKPKERVNQAIAKGILSTDEGAKLVAAMSGDNIAVRDLKSLTATLYGGTQEEQQKAVTMDLMMNGKDPQVRTAIADWAKEHGTSSVPASVIRDIINTKAQDKADSTVDTYSRQRAIDEARAVSKNEREMKAYQDKANIDTTKYLAEHGGTDAERDQQRAKANADIDKVKKASSGDFGTYVDNITAESSAQGMVSKINQDPNALVAMTAKTNRQAKEQATAIYNTITSKTDAIVPHKLSGLESPQSIEATSKAYHMLQNKANYSGSGSDVKGYAGKVTSAIQLNDTVSKIVNDYNKLQTLTGDKAFTDWKLGGNTFATKWINTVKGLFGKNTSTSDIQAQISALDPVKDKKKLESLTNALGIAYSSEWDTEAFLTMKSMLQQISGMGVTNVELQSFSQAVTGGTYASIPQMMTKLKNVSLKQIRDTKTNLQGIENAGGFGDALDLSVNLNKASMWRIDDAKYQFKNDVAKVGKAKAASMLKTRLQQYNVDERLVNAIMQRVGG